MSDLTTTITPADVLLRLKDQYKNIFTEDSIRRHFENHVNDTVAFHHLNFVSLYGTPRSLLDIGCGYGSFVMLARDKGINALGIEIEPFEVRYARQRVVSADPSKVFFEGTAYDIPFGSESFDSVTLWDVLEHIEDCDRVLDEVNRVLKKGGRIFISCPNYFSFRKEAHYHVPWLPLFPKKWASLYLRMLGRDPRFLNQAIFYRTNRQILRGLQERNFEIIDHRLNRIEHPELVNQRTLRLLLKFLQILGLSRLIASLLKIQTLNPFKKSIVVCAEKKN